MLDKNDLRMIGELLDEKIAPIKEDLREVKERVTNLEVRMDRLEVRMDGLEAKVDGLKKEVADLRVETRVASIRLERKIDEHYDGLLNTFARVEEHYSICEEARKDFNERINSNTTRLDRYRGYWSEIAKITQSMAA